MTAKQDVEALIERLDDSERLYDEEVRVTDLHHLLTDAAALLRSQASEVERLREQVRVPREPTGEMLEAMSEVFRNGSGTVREAYRAMIAAAQEQAP